MFQTIKCLLIVPNAESALNEEAGKMLLEHYDDYSQRAKMMTEIHAQVRQQSSPVTLKHIYFNIFLTAIQILEIWYPVRRTTG